MTVLGKSPAWQDAGGACSGYLVEAGGSRLLLDCGPGVLGKLRTYCDYAAVDAVVISHLHADHILDLIPFGSALTYSPRGVAGDVPRPPLHVPPGGREQLAALCRAAGMSDDHLERAFAIAEYDPAGRLEAAGMTLRFQPVPHYVESHAVEIAADGARLTFGGDCGPNAALPEFAADTDLLLLEATMPPGDNSAPEGHLTAEQAGEHGRRAGARRLVLTHISDELDAAATCAAAAAAFGSDVEIAAEGAVYSL
jgi:ribonuclease BN (tRNA processing enzyme)